MLRYRFFQKIQSEGESVSCYIPRHRDALHQGVARQEKHHRVVPVLVRKSILIIIGGEEALIDLAVAIVVDAAAARAAIAVHVAGGAGADDQARGRRALLAHLDGDVDWREQAEAYRQRIERHLAATVLPDLPAHVISSRLLTPLDFRDRLWSVKGAAFSLEPVLTQTAWFRPHNRSEEIEGLYLVGAGTHPGAGMPGVISSAEVLGKNPSDAELDKSTYVALYGLEEARRRAHAEVERAIAAGFDEPADLAKARAAMERALLRIRVAERRHREGPRQRR